MNPHAIQKAIIQAADCQVAAHPDARLIVDAGFGEQLGRLITAISANASNPIASNCEDELAAALKRVSRPFEGFDDLRTLVAKTEALSASASDHFDQISWSRDVDRRSIERQAHLSGAAAEAAEQALRALDEINSDLATGEPTSNDRW